LGRRGDNGEKKREQQELFSCFLFPLIFQTPLQALKLSTFPQFRFFVSSLLPHHFFSYHQLYHGTLTDTNYA
jgi:hypothetical protein